MIRPQILKTPVRARPVRREAHGAGRPGQGAHRRARCRGGLATTRSKAGASARGPNQLPWCQLKPDAGKASATRSVCALPRACASASGDKSTRARWPSGRACKTGLECPARLRPMQPLPQPRSRARGARRQARQQGQRPGRSGPSVSGRGDQHRRADRKTAAIELALAQKVGPPARQRSVARRDGVPVRPHRAKGFHRHGRSARSCRIRAHGPEADAPRCVAGHCGRSAGHGWWQLPWFRKGGPARSIVIRRRQRHRLACLRHRRARASCSAWMGCHQGLDNLAHLALHDAVDLVQRQV